MRISDWSSDVCSSDLANAPTSGLYRNPGWRKGLPGARSGVSNGNRIHEPAACPARDLERATATVSVSPRLAPHTIRYKQLGRASFRERVCQSVLVSVVAVSLKKKLHALSTHKS